MCGNSGCAEKRWHETHAEVLQAWGGAALQGLFDVEYIGSNFVLHPNLKLVVRPSLLA